MLELKNLIYGYSDRALNESFSATVREGKIIFLVGKNGAGKTTLMKTLAGLIEPTSGQIESSTRPIFLPAQVSVADTLTGLDIQEIYGANKSDLPWTLPMHRPFSTFSSGEQRQALLAATLSHSSPVVLLDEPFNFLDWHHTIELISEITRQSKNGRIFILATHHLDWILRFENSETWALIDTPEKNTRTIYAGETKSILTSETFQRAFGLGIQILKNPMGEGHVLAISPRG